MEKCLISKESIEYKITLPCQHSYEYIYLYYELLEQKKKRLKGFSCPYCRHSYDMNIPYYELNDIDKINNLNYKQIKTLNILKCEKCDKAGHLFKHGTFCIQHSIYKPLCLSICKNGNKCKNKSLTNHKYCKIHLNK
jgi:hypothetical protein